MLLKLLLFVLAKRIAWLAENSDEFKASIKKRRCVLQFKTDDDKICRYYQFAAGDVKSIAALHASPNLSLSFAHKWVIVELAAKMAKAPDDKTPFIEAIDAGKIKITGDISLLTWFMTVSDYFAPDAIK